MDIIPQAITDVLLIRPRKFEDARGYFSETFSAPAAAKAGLPENYIQDNLSLSRKTGTIRGLHFQTPPFAQAKLVRVIRGRILDVAVDLRKGSPHYGQHVAVELSGSTLDQLFIPEGFAHGFCTLEDDTEVFYKVTAPYAPANDAGIIWNDPDLGIKWPVNAQDAVLSDKDAKHPPFKELPQVFTYEQKERKSA